MKIAEFMGWKGIYSTIDWDIWMSEVEPRIREQGLWEDYISMLCGRLNSIFPEVVMLATLEQRAEALVRVLDGSQTQEVNNV